VCVCVCVCVCVYAAGHWTYLGAYVRRVELERKSAASEQNAIDAGQQIAQVVVSGIKGDDRDLRARRLEPFHIKCVEASGDDARAQDVQRVVTW
jgi:hypothetical protein